MPLPGLLSRVLTNGLVKKPVTSCVGGFISRHASLWEPDYLILAHTKTPEYDLLNVQITGYDFVILEQYQKLIRKIAKQMKIKVNSNWAAPPKDLEIHHYKTSSTEVQYKYNMKFCERNIQIIDAKGHILALFIEALITTCPPGVKLSIHEHEDYMENDRYIPNLALIEKNLELQNMTENKDKKDS